MRPPCCFFPRNVKITLAQSLYRINGIPEKAESMTYHRLSTFSLQQVSPERERSTEEWKQLSRHRGHCRDLAGGGHWKVPSAPGDQYLTIIFDVSLFDVAKVWSDWDHDPRWLATAILQWCVSATVAPPGRSLQSKLLTRWKLTIVIVSAAVRWLCSRCLLFMDLDICNVVSALELIAHFWRMSCFKWVAGFLDNWKLEFTQNISPAFSS